MIFRNCIIDMNARIGKNVVITNSKVSESTYMAAETCVLIYPTLVLWPWVPLFVTGHPRGWSPGRRVLHKVWNRGDLEECNHQGRVHHIDVMRVCLQIKNLQWYYIDGTCKAWNAVPWTLVLLSMFCSAISCPGSCSKPFMNLCISISLFGSTILSIILSLKFSWFC